MIIKALSKTRDYTMFTAVDYQSTLGCMLCRIDHNTHLMYGSVNNKWYAIEPINPIWIAYYAYRQLRLNK